MNLALFDFDGTITTRELFRPFLEFAVPSRRLRWGGLLLAPMVAGYKLGAVSSNTMRACAVRLGLRGMALDRADDKGRRFASEIIPGVLREHALERIRWHQRQGDRVVVVSGALDIYLSHWCRAQGLELLCSRLEIRGDRLTGRYHGAQCVSAEKPRRVREAYDLDAYPVVYAYGDTHEDLDLLRIAHHRYYRWRELD
ncbi:HAD family hydrolase [Dyella sedimenti]|uniref:HAD family hydrolase n=1 Tax=Dyella sedimenti TaxID=2919947 RepID=UPI001FA9F978|nr:HAD family hydrolase [Dyella sedimenti]